MTLRAATLADRFDLAASPVLLTGTQALVRLMLMQAAADRAAGLRTAGYVTGYRGSPLGAVDVTFERAGAALAAASVRFQAALNEDLAATALWGTQGAEARGEGRYDGVFGLWYGKGPGVDRSGDAFRHGNLAGSSRQGGVLVAMGDDHTGESSTTVHQSEFAAMDAQMPVLSPAGVQEILDYGLYGYALSRFSGLWVALKLQKDTVESTAVVDGAPGRWRFADLPHPGLNLRLPDHWVPQEARMGAKLAAARAFGAANGIDRVGWPRQGARIGVVAAGKVWLDVEQALGLLGLAPGQGVTTFKVGQVWPLVADGIADWAAGLDLIIVVEEKRGLIEPQLKEVLFDRGLQPQVAGKSWQGSALFPVPQVLDPVMIARLIARVAGDRLPLSVPGDLPEAAPAAPDRLPYFCAGCPHNTSTVVPDGARAGAGIGCHTMALWMDRSTSGLTQMGAEGANWIGEAPFSTRPHVFQNMGDGTFNHSGIMAIRAAVAAGVNITYKVLWNDAVAMTGGQGMDGGLTPQRAAAEMLAAGVNPVVLVHDPAEGLDPGSFPAGVQVETRDALDAVQRRLAGVTGTSAILYVQTCAAEKRRRRKRGLMPVPETRVVIHPEVCEGCGDCGVQSNCVAIQPLETALGRKRQIDPSACNLDMTCLKGFCPAFVTVTGGAEATARAAPTPPPSPLPDPVIPVLSGVQSLLITGIGGTGVVTVGAILTMAAHLDGKGAGMIEVTGMAQKGGAVLIHARIGESPEAIRAIRLAPGECDTLLAGDLVVAAGGKALPLLATGRTRAVINTAEVVTGAFTRDRDFRLPVGGMRTAVAARAETVAIDAGALALRHLGDALFANMIVAGAAWQRGWIALSREAIEEAIRLNGAASAQNLAAFDLGRAAALGLAPGSPPAPAADPERDWSSHLAEYGGPALVARWRAGLGPIADPALREVVAVQYARLLAPKDEYEVARLLARTRKATGLADGARLTFHLAPPGLSRPGPDGRPGKRAFGPWSERLWPWLARMAGLRGTWADPFRRSAERVEDRALLALYEQDLPRIAAAPPALALALARWPDQVKGFGPVRAAGAVRARAARDAALAALAAPIAVAAE